MSAPQGTASRRPASSGARQRHALRPRRLMTMAAVAVSVSWLAVGCGGSTKTTTSPKAPSSTPFPFSSTATTNQPPSSNRGTPPVEVPATAPSGSTVTALPNDQFSKVGEVPVSTGPGQTTKAVTVLQPDPANEQLLLAAFDSYEQLPPNCLGQNVAGTVHLATINASRVSWAISAFAPNPGCTKRYLPFVEGPGPTIGVFERQPQGMWTMNSEAGKPFPCPPTQYQQPGSGKPQVPKAVLDAWDIPYYSPNCSPVYPPPPE